MGQASSVITGLEDPRHRDMALERETTELANRPEAQSEPDADSDES